MFKTRKPDLPSWEIAKFPHCDRRILHAPGECEFCDKHALWQALRIAWGIAFTGWSPDIGELPCPANNARGDMVDQRWAGNRSSRQKEPNA